MEMPHGILAFLCTFASIIQFMKKRLPLFFIILFVLIRLSAIAQISDSAIKVHLFRIDYGFSFPAGDLADRFGACSSIGASYHFKTARNLMAGVSCSYFFGGKVKIADDLFSQIQTSQGFIIDATGGAAFMDTYERGFSVMGSLGKIIPGTGKNPNSGILASAGAGYLSHHIRTEVAMNAAPQVYDEYAKGYDRKAGGFVYNLFLGYQFIDEQNIFNLYGGLDFSHALTVPLRGYQFDLMGPEPAMLRNDFYIGVKVGWMLPFYQRSVSSYYYY